MNMIILVLVTCLHGSVDSKRVGNLTGAQAVKYMEPGATKGAHIQHQVWYLIAKDTF